MTTKGFFFIPLLFFFFFYTYVFFDAHSRPLTVKRNQGRTTRSRAVSRLYTGDYPPAQRLSCHRVQRQPPLPSRAPPYPIRPTLWAESPNPGS